MGMHGLYPWVELVAAIRDIVSAFLLLRIRPALSLLMATEFPEIHMPLQRDLVRIYLVMPFGWDGAPPNFARLGDAIASAHLKCGLSRGTMRLNHAFPPAMYVDDGISIELNMPRRLKTPTMRR